MKSRGVGVVVVSISSAAAVALLAGVALDEPKSKPARHDLVEYLKSL
ncbi:MAG TPA: hypothetical protein VFD27_10215 [Chthoniobacteraceae bacterium]|jgi:hypothetical protein|nr:hypothetical protein [Chthoniobacteraceae bacterium]